jgi:hypothetical protein
MDFNDQLKDIVAKQKALYPEGDEILDEETLKSIFEAIDDKDTFGYIVYVTKDGRNGLVSIGKMDCLHLSYAHRVADALIDVIMMDEGHD